MNLFHYLKSIKGAIKPLNALAISGAAGLIFAYTVNTVTDNDTSARRSVRSLTSIEGTRPQQGMHRQRGMLTAINVQDGENRLATPQERAAMRGNSALDKYEANQRALANMDQSLGRAAEFTQSDGLNTGNRDYATTPARYVVGNPNANMGTVVGSDGVAQAPGSGTFGREGNHLPPASMTRASGSEFSGTSGAVGGGIVSNPAAPAGGPQGAPQRLSGAMPGGTNIVSQMGLDTGNQPTRPSFARNRDGQVRPGRRLPGEKDELKDIVKKSARAAYNPNASGNEGGRAFLASNQSSEGVSVTGEGDDETPGATSEDVSPSAVNRNLDAVGDKLEDIDLQQELRQQAQRDLIKLLIGMILTSFTCMVIGATVLPKLKNNVWGQIARWIIAAMLVGAVAAFAAILIKAAKAFKDDYGAMGGTGIATASMIIAPILLAGMVFVAICPEKVSFLRKIGEKIVARLRKISLVDQAFGFMSSKLTGLFFS